MKPIKTTLLFSAPPKLDVSAWHRALEARIGRTLTARPNEGQGQVLRLNSYDWAITIATARRPISPNVADAVTRTFIAAPVKADLDQTLQQARDQIVITLQPMPGEGVYLLPRERLEMLQHAHAAVSAIFAETAPDLIIWHHANQAVSAGQYAQIADDPTPLALFVRAVPDEHDLRLEPHADLLDHPIRLKPGRSTVEHAYAAGLAFLRHAIAKGAPLPDGDRFGPVRGCAVRVAHGTNEYQLTMQPMGMPQNPDRLPGPNATALASVQAKLRDRAESTPKNTGPGAIMSTIMSFSLPPLGLVLLVTNALMGSNAFRSAIITMGSLAVALFTASWVVISERSTVPINIAASTLANQISVTD